MRASTEAQREGGAGKTHVSDSRSDLLKLEDSVMAEPFRHISASEVRGASHPHYSRRGRGQPSCVLFGAGTFVVRRLCLESRLKRTLC